MSEQAVCNLRLKKIPPTGNEKDAYLRSILVSEGMTSFKDFLMWYNNKDIVPTLEAMQKTIEFYHQKGLICQSWVVLYLIWQTFACINQQNQSFNLLLKATKTCLRKFVKL